jgi:tetratricopeptide (TPR) repeat protein
MFASIGAFEMPLRRSRLIAALIVVAIIVSLLFVPRWYLRSRHRQIAERHQHIAQAICNFHAQHGLLPYELNDLVPEYLPRLPAGPRFSHGILSIHTGLPHTYVSYSFRGQNAGWESGGDFGAGKLPVPIVVPSVPIVDGDERVIAALAEYNRRIEAAENDEDSRWHRTQKIAYLLSVKENDEAYAACIDAAKAHPAWWRPQMGLAMLSPIEEKDVAEDRLREWVEKHPGFVHYWYLAHLYRINGRLDDALESLRHGAQYPLEDIDPDATWVPHAFAFDAATFACKHQRPELVLAITDMWASPRGVYNFESPDLPAFRAAAMLALGRGNEAKIDVAKVTRTRSERAIWAGNLEELNSAIQRNDRSFVYDPGTPYVGFFEWSMFPDPDP